ncbi:MAG TPA: DUF4419 domain-containing protein [Haliangium sp.]|nr:DUF4419 domain-containing protein [Haliangium sp.]
MRSPARIIDLTDTVFPHPLAGRMELVNDFVAEIQERRGVHLAPDGARLQRRPAPSPEYTGFLEAVLDQPGHDIRVEVASHALTLAGRNDPASLFYQGLQLAFTAHHGFAIRPEVLMYMVNAAIAETVRRHPEHYRHLFTRESETAEIKVRHDGLQPGSPEGWDQAIALFEHALRQRVPDGIMQHMLPALSTHTTASKIASLISFMDAASAYYDYTVMTLCGIPAIRIDGTPEDYRAVTAACAGLAEQFAPHLGAYFDDLLPVLDRIARQAAGEERDVDFWQSMYSYESMSGSATMDGWATVFLAYWKQRDGSLVPRHEHPQHRPATTGWSAVPSDAVPPHVSTVPFVWDYYGTPHRMELAGGILGLGNQDDFVTPELGWAVITRAAEASQPR